MSQRLVRFFHERATDRAFQISVILRTGFAALYLMERVWLSNQIDVLLLPSNGMLPLEAAQNHEQCDDRMWTIFQAAPHSDRLLLIVQQLGLWHGMLLLLGIFPRIQLLGIFLNLVCFQHHNVMIWEYSDTLFRIFALLLMSLPVHRHGLSDWFRKKCGLGKSDDATTWPMWSFRVIQIFMTTIYISTALSVWQTPPWWSGEAFFSWRNSDAWNPMCESVDRAFQDITTARYATWAALALFSTCWGLVWLPISRNAIVATMVAFHLYLETLSNTYFLNTLLALGWLTFLVTPNPKIRPTSVQNQTIASFGVAVVLVLFFLDAAPLELATDFLPSAFRGPWDEVVAWQYDLYGSVETVLLTAGLWQGIWDLSVMHSIMPYPNERGSLEAYLTFKDGSERVWESPDFASMSWLERRQNGRIMNYFAALASPAAAPLALGLCHALEQTHDATSCELVHLVESIPLPTQASSEIFVPKSDATMHLYRSIVSVHYCVDQLDHCAILQNAAGAHFCTESGIGDACAATCGSCEPLVEINECMRYYIYSENNACEDCAQNVGTNRTTGEYNDDHEETVADNFGHDEEYEVYNDDGTEDFLSAKSHGFQTGLPEK